MSRQINGLFFFIETQLIFLLIMEIKDLMFLPLPDSLIQIIQDYVSRKHAVALLTNQLYHQLTSLNKKRKHLMEKIAELEAHAEMDAILEDVMLKESIHFLDENGETARQFQLQQESLKKQEILVLNDKIRVIESFERTDRDGLDRVAWRPSSCGNHCPHMEDNSHFVHGLSYRDPQAKERVCGKRLRRQFPKLTRHEKHYDCNPKIHELSDHWELGSEWQMVHVTCYLVAVVHTSVWEKYCHYWREEILRESKEGVYDSE
jgi:hypothetical protein